MKGQNHTLTGNLACFAAYTIFGFNIISCKGIALDGHITPMALFCLRAFGATALFWLWSLFTAPREQIERRDVWKVVLASFLGLFLTQLSFLLAITRTTAIDASIMSTLSPIMALVISALFVGERITWSGVAGIGLSLVGVLILIFNCVSIRSGADSTSVSGLLGMLVNTLSFASYVGIFRPLIRKYSVVTFMKWMFLFSFVFALPFSLKGLLAVQYAQIPANVLLEIGFLIFFATFVAYFLIPVGQKNIRPTIVSMYSYLQPIIAAVVAVAVGMDVFTWKKLLAAALVVAGVVIVNRSRSANFS